MDLCKQCGHDFNTHALICTKNDDPRYGGIILCPWVDCQCFSTWGVPQLSVEQEDVFVPDRAEIEELREMIQHETSTGG